MKKRKVNSVCKIRIILAGIFVFGVLLGGVGTGIAFVEYSSFAYAGEKTMGEENLVTRHFDQPFDPAKGRVGVEVGWYGYGDGEGRMVADPSVPENLVRYEVTYNEKAVTPCVVFDEFEEENQDWDEEPEHTGVQETDESQEAAEVSEGPADAGSSGQEPPSGPQDRLQGRVLLRVRYTGNDFALWMEYKDDFLKELRERKIASYQQVTLADVTIKVNPATLPYVEDWAD